MSGRLPALAGQLTRWWVALYSSGLPTPVGDRRRAELDSDLWEHQDAARALGQRPAATALAIAARLVRGIPADLSWRIQARRTARRVARRTAAGLPRRRRPRRPGLLALEATAVTVTVTAGWLVAVEQLLRDGWIAGGGTAWLLAAAAAASLGGLAGLLAAARGRPAWAAAGLLVAAVAPTGFAYALNLVLIALAAAEAVRGGRRRARPRPRPRPWPWPWPWPWGGGGPAGVRQPRRPGPRPPAGAVALPLPTDPPDDLRALG
jgi:hypothetical protein